MVLLRSSAELTKTWLAHTTGVAAGVPGKGAVQRTFSVRENSTGRLVSGLEPLKDGPRHWAQFSAQAGRAGNATSKATAIFSLGIICHTLEQEAGGWQLVRKALTPFLGLRRRGRMRRFCVLAVADQCRADHDKNHPGPT